MSDAKLSSVDEHLARARHEVRHSFIELYGC